MQLFFEREIGMSRSHRCLNASIRAHVWRRMREAYACGVWVRSPTFKLLVLQDRKDQPVMT